MFDGVFVFSRNYPPALIEKLLEATASVLPKFRAGQHYTRVDSAGESLSGPALAQEFGLTSFFFQSYIPQSFPRE
jgi:hypothetical protein